MSILKQCPVPILQEPWEFEKLVEKFKDHAPKKVLEIGSFYGGTLWYWSQFLVRVFYGDITRDPMDFIDYPQHVGYSSSITSIDYPIGPYDGRYVEMLKCRQLWPGWMKGIEFNDIQGDSHNPAIIQKVHDLHSGRSIDFLFIDGDHSYNGVKADFENYAPLVRPGGLIVFHDVYGLPEVKQFWEELKQNHRTETIIGQPGGWGIGILYKQ